MIIELAIALVVFAGLLFWLGTGGRWKWAVAASAIPLVLLVLILRETSTFPDAPAGFEQLIIGIFLAIFLSGLVSFGIGRFVNRNRPKKAEQEIK